MKLVIHLALGVSQQRRHIVCKSQTIIKSYVSIYWSLLMLMNKTLKTSFIQTYKFSESKLSSKYEINDEMVSELTSIAIALNL
jgi:hypothetical protein